MLAEDPPRLEDQKWEWPEIRDDILRSKIGDALEYRGKALVRLSHVCRRWREVTLSLSSLWATLVAQYRHTNRPDNQYEAVLERSRGSPLSFILPHDLLDSYMEAQLVDNLARFDTIMFNDEYNEWPLELSGKRASLLRIAVFITESYPDEDTAPPNVLELAPLEMPVATHLAFDGLYMPFVAPQLTSLAISLQKACLSAQYINDILRHTPLLESLNLIQYYPAPGRQGWPPELGSVGQGRGRNSLTQRVSLSRLAFLKIWGSTSDITSILLNLDAPSNATLNVNTYRIGDFPSFGRLIDALRPYMTHTSYDHLTISDCYENGEGLDGPPFFSLRQGSDGPRRVAIHLDINFTDLIAAYTIVFTRLVEGQIRKLSIEDWSVDFAPAFTSGATGEAFHLNVLSQYVEDLRFETPAATAYTYEFESERRWGKGLLPDFLLYHPKMYPALRRISVRGGSKDHSSWPTESQLLHMKSWLDSRIEAGTATDVLHLEGCIPEGASRYLNALGDAVHVIDSRQAVAPPPPRTAVYSPDSSDSEEFYTLFAQHHAQFW